MMKIKIFSLIFCLGLLFIGTNVYAHPFTCACGGTGVLCPICPDCSNGSTSCNSCNGSGVRKERCYNCHHGYVNKEVSKRCSNCSNGKVTMTDSAPCGSCRNGKRPTTYNGQTVYQTCNVCYGSGTRTVTRNVTCPVCHGTRYSGTETKQERCSQCSNGYKEVSCNMCGGDGMRSCRRCGGSGRISKPCPY